MDSTGSCLHHATGTNQQHRLCRYTPHNMSQCCAWPQQTLPWQLNCPVACFLQHATARSTTAHKLGRQAPSDRHAMCKDPGHPLKISGCAVPGCEASVPGRLCVHAGLLDDAYSLSHVRQLNISIFLTLVNALGVRARPELPPWSTALGWLQRMTDVLSTAGVHLRG